MNDDRIVDALRRRPSDEGAFERPLRLTARQEEGAEPMSGLIPSLGLRRADGRRQEIRSRTPIRALPALAAVLVLLGVVVVMAFQQGNQAGPVQPSDSARPSAAMPSTASSVAASAAASGTPARSGDIPVVPPNVTPSAQPTALLYTVKSNDGNLTRIAARYNTTVVAIVAYNELMGPQFQIKDPNVIWVGRQFYIPPPGWTPGPKTTATAERSK